LEKAQIMMEIGLSRLVDGFSLPVILGVKHIVMCLEGALPFLLLGQIES
jgi:hypothetical protein